MKVVKNIALSITISLVGGVFIFLFATLLTIMKGNHEIPHLINSAHGMRINDQGAI